MNFFFFYTQTMEADTQWALCSINCHNPNCSPSVPNPMTTFETFYKWSRHIIWFAQNKVVSTEVTGSAEIPGDGDRGNPTFVTTRFTTAVKWTLVGGHCATSLINGKVTKLFIKHKFWEREKKKLCQSRFKQESISVYQPRALSRGQTWSHGWSLQAGSNVSQHRWQWVRRRHNLNSSDTTLMLRAKSNRINIKL